jgi:hypothetical protein
MTQQLENVPSADTGASHGYVEPLNLGDGRSPAGEIGRTKGQILSLVRRNESGEAVVRPKEVAIPASKLSGAWRRYPELQKRVATRFGEELANELLVLWAIARFGGGESPAHSVLDELVDEQFQARFSDQLIEDVARFAFALGAGWATAEGPDSSFRIHAAGTRQPGRRPNK